MPQKTHARVGRWRALGTGLLCVLVAACSTPADRFVEAATAHGFEHEAIAAGPHRLLLLRAGRRAPHAPLHVYLDGDGRPWLSRRQVAADPTSRSRLMLQLLHADSAARVLIGRPCYYGQSVGCAPALWTTERYGEAVVRSMAKAIDDEIARIPASRVTLIGYSGGGALAMLIAPRLQRLDALVTVAANLDIGAWVRHHGYSPLSGSLDPALQAPLAAHIRQVHLFGADDEIVPARLMRHVAERQPNVRIEVLADYDHDCCWAATWTQLLTATLPDDVGGIDD